MTIKSIEFLRGILIKEQGVVKIKSDFLIKDIVHWWQLACNSELQPWLTDGEHVKIPENIMSGESFDCVSLILKVLQ